MILPFLAGRPALALGGFALAGAALGLAFAFVDMSAKRAMREQYAAGVEAGRTEMALQYRTAAETIRAQAEREIAAREAQTAARIAESGRQAEAATRERNRALAALRSQNADLDRCLALPYPDSVRAHLPAAGGVRGDI